VQSLSELTWLVLQDRDAIHPGDRVYVWESGPAGGIVGTAEVLDEVREREELEQETRFIRNAEKLEGAQPRVNLRRLRVVDPILSRAQIRSTPALTNLSILRQAQGTNFPVTPEEAEALDDLLGRTSMSPEIERIL